MRVLGGVFILAGAVLLAPVYQLRAAPKPVRSIVINLPALRLYLYENGRLLHDYPVAVGKPATPTPIGQYRIINKIPNPVWHPASKNPVPPGPRNPLGRWWLGLNLAGYGIHGCLDETSIGQAVTLGCVRLHNRDVQQLAALVGPGTAVSIVYEPLALYEERPGGRLFLWLGRDIYQRQKILIQETLDFLEKNLAYRLDPGMVATILARAPAPGWRELPRPVRCYWREREAGLGYLYDGRLFFARRTARLLPGGQGLAESGEDVELADLAFLAGESVDWRFRPELMTMTALPARLRLGGRIWEDAVRLERGRVYLRPAAVREALGAEWEDLTAGAEDWVGLERLIEAGLELRWDEEEWEVVAG